MKKIIATIILILSLCFSLSSCSLNLDFSEAIGEKMDEIYTTIKDLVEPFLKEDESYQTDENTDENQTLPEENGGENNEN